MMFLLKFKIYCLELIYVVLNLSFINKILTIKSLILYNY